MANTGLDDDPRLASLDSSLDRVRNMNADRAPAFTELLSAKGSTKSRTQPARHSP
jgi:hypothetical protein